MDLLKTRLEHYRQLYSEARINSNDIEAQKAKRMIDFYLRLISRESETYCDCSAFCNEKPGPGKMCLLKDLHK